MESWNESEMEDSHNEAHVKQVFVKIQEKGLVKKIDCWACRRVFKEGDKVKIKADGDGAEGENFDKEIWWVVTSVTVDDHVNHKSRKKS